MNIIMTVNQIFGILFCVLYAYTFVYMAYAFFTKKELSHKPTRPHKFAVLIPARNEEVVITQLIDSIRKQTYDPSLITIFVIADNCTDHTADAARKAGAIVYERFNKKLVGKGYAMNELLHYIMENYPDQPFDGFFVFDADNVLDPNYIEEMNKTFSDGYKVITSYRNSKNFGDNWVSAGYGMTFLREAKYLNHARMLLGNSCAISGTGYLVDWSLVKEYDGWPFHLLTEDLEFTCQCIIHGDKIGYCKDAVFYDEQPTSFKVSWRQRIRWLKGSLQVFLHYGMKLFGKAFKGSFSAFDMGMIVIPLPSIGFFLATLNLIFCLTFLLMGNLPAAGQVGFFLFNFLFGTYGGAFIAGVLTVFTESAQIHTTTKKKIGYLFTFPIFVITSMPIGLAAMFQKVTWTPIVHTKSVSVSDITSDKK